MWGCSPSSQSNQNGLSEEIDRLSVLWPRTEEGGIRARQRMSGVTGQLGELDGGEELHEGLFIGAGRWWRGRSHGGGRPASLAGGFNGARPLASFAERRLQRRGGTG